MRSAVWLEEPFLVASLGVLRVPILLPREHWGGLLTDALGGAGGGAILTGIVGAVMKAMNK